MKKKKEEGEEGEEKDEDQEEYDFHHHHILFHDMRLYYVHTPWKINMEPENTPPEKENHLPNHHFQVLC